MNPPNITAAEYLWIHTYLRVHATYATLYGDLKAQQEAKVSADYAVDNFKISFPKDDIQPA